MGLDDVLKNVLGEETYKEKGSALKKELAKEVIPKHEFNAKLDLIKDLESDKETLLNDKKELEDKVKEAEKGGLSDLGKLQKSIETLTKDLQSEKTKREDSEKALNDEKLSNTIKSKLTDAKMKSKFIDKYINDFKGIKEDEFSDKLKEFAENNKELFGEDNLGGKKPEGEFNENNGSKHFTKEQVEAMSDAEVQANMDAIDASMTKW